MDEVRLAEHREVGPVVDDERDAEPSRDLARLVEPRQQLGVGQTLLANLDDVDAAAHGRLEKLGEIVPHGGDEVEPAIHPRRGGRR